MAAREAGRLRRKGCAVRCGAASGRRTRAGTTTVRSIGSATPARELAEWRDFTGEWRRDPFDRDARTPGALRAPARARGRHGHAAVHSRSAVHRYRACARAEPRHRDGASASVPTTATGGKRGWSIWRVIATSGGRARAATACSAPWPRAMRCGRSTRRSVTRSTRSSAPPTPTWPRCCTTNCARWWTATSSLKQRAGALDFVDLLLRARDLLVTHQSVRAAFQRAVRAPLRRRVPGHRSAAGRDPAAAGGRRCRRSRTGSGPSGARQAVHRRRSRSRRSTASARADVETYREVCELLESRGATRAFLSTSFRIDTGDSARGERELRAGDDR